jgi:methyl-accepting chemotaxis protein
MNTKNVKISQPHKQRPWLKWSQLKVIVVPAISTIGILVVGISSSIQFPSQFYMAGFLLIAIFVFYFQKMIMSRMQSEIDTKSKLLESLNQQLTQYKTHLEKNYAVQQEDLHKLHRQLNQLAYEIKPVMDGDLRVKSTLRTGSIGAIAEICNALIEDLARLIQWTQYMASHVLQITHTHQSHIGEWAKTTETLQFHLSTMTESVERLVAFILRLDSALQAGIDSGEEILTSIHREMVSSMQVTTDAEASAFLKRLTSDIQEQVKLLGEIASSAQGIAEIAEPLLGEFYTFARQFNHSKSLVVKAAEGSSSLAMLADNWSQASQAFTVSEDNLQDGDIEDENILLQPSTIPNLEEPVHQ